MIIFAIDDEAAMLAELHDAIAEAEPNAEPMPADLDFCISTTAIISMDAITSKIVITISMIVPPK